MRTWPGSGVWISSSAGAGGWAVAIAQAGLARSMAYAVGMLNNVPHGAACGIAVPAVMHFNVDFATDKLALGVSIANMDPRVSDLSGAITLESLMESAGHPKRLSEVGVTGESLATAPFHALADAPALFNARPVSDPNEVAELFKQVWQYGQSFSPAAFLC